MRVYSPSQTDSFMENPAVRRLKYIEKWRPRLIKNPDLARILGSAVSAGLAEYNRARRDSLPLDPDAAGRVAAETARLDLKHLQSHGLTPTGRETETARLLPERAYKAVTRYIAQDPIPLDWKIVAVEPILKDHGWARPDLVLRSPLGLVPLDYKTKLTLDEKYKERTLNEYRYSWAMLHYAWACEEVFKEPVASYYISLITVEPRFKVLLDPTIIDPEIMELWKTSARSVWAVMAMVDRGELKPWHTFKFFDRFGKNEYADSLLLHKWHDHLMERDYIKLPAKER